MLTVIPTWIVTWKVFPDIYQDRTMRVPQNDLESFLRTLVNNGVTRFSVVLEGSEESR